MTPKELLKIQAGVSYKDWNLVVRFDVDSKGNMKDVRLFWEWEAPCKDTQEVKTWTSRTWMVENLQADSILKTAMLAARQAEEHECMENFRYMGRKVFDPHRSVV